MLQIIGFEHLSRLVLLIDLIDALNRQDGIYGLILAG